ncbi:MAG: sulfatase [Alteraurantiacibacter sp.]
MKNYLLISLDTLRADVAYSGRFRTVERIRARGTTFRSAVASAPLTPPSHASVLSGVHPWRHGLRHLFREQINDDTVLIAEHFQRSGYSTGAVVSCPGLNAWYGFDRGFDTFDDEIPLLADGSDPLQTVDVKLRGTALKRANVVADRAIDWLQAREEQAFFLFIHFFDSHWPYEAPETHGEIKNNYEGEIAFMDHHLGRVIDHLETSGRLDDTTIILFSDHGEDLDGCYANDKAGPRGHTEEEGHGALLYDQTQSVALVVSEPGTVPQGVTVAPQVRLIDIAPTLADLAGLSMDRHCDGQTLRPIWEGQDTRHRPAYFETFYRNEITDDDGAPAGYKPLAGVRLDDRWKVIWEPAGLDAAYEVYDLHSDPLEWSPILARADIVPVPDASAQPLDDDGLEAVAAQVAATAPAAAKQLRALIKALSERPSCGIAVDGSLAKGRFDDLSDIDLTLTFPYRGPSADDLQWVRDCVARSGDVLSAFPALHLGMPHLLIFFLRVDAQVVKVDIRCDGPAEDRRPGAVTTLRPGDGCTDGRPSATPASFDPTLSWNRLIGWAWYCVLKLRRDELFAAEEGLAGIRNDILIPAMRQLAGAPQTGTYRIEADLSVEDRAQLHKTFAMELTAPALSASLAAAIGAGKACLSRLVPPGQADGFAQSLEFIRQHGQLSHDDDT